MSKSKTIIIGGITGGIGSALAKQLLSQGHSVAGYARNAEKNQQFTQETGAQATICDATVAEELDTTLSKFQSSLGSIDAYVHAIGSIFIKPAHLTTPEDWMHTLQMNLSSAFYGLRSATKIMNKQSSGSCLFFSTAAAQAGLANHEAIAAAKGGIDAMVRSAASTYSARGIRINAIAPSLTATPLAQTIIGTPQALEFSKKLHPLGNIAEADDVANLAAWLISDAANFVTGQTFVIDGGLSSIIPKPKI